MPLPIAKMAAMGGISDLLRKCNKFTVIKNTEESCLNRVKIMLKVTGQVIHLPWRFSSCHFKDCATHTPVEKTQTISNSNWTSCRTIQGVISNRPSAWYKLFHRLIYSTSKLDAEKEPIQVQLARA